MLLEPIEREATWAPPLHPHTATRVPRLVRDLAGGRAKVSQGLVDLERRARGVVPVSNAARCAAGRAPPRGEADTGQREGHKGEDGADGVRRADGAEGDVVVARPELEVVDLEEVPREPVDAHAREVGAPVATVWCQLKQFRGGGGDGTDVMK